jgi:hypothetical protein
MGIEMTMMTGILTRSRRAMALTALLTLTSFGAVHAAPPRADGLVARFPFELLANAIFIPLHVNGKGPYLFSLDTGSSNSVVATEVAEELAISAGETFQSTGAGSDANMASSIARLDFTLPGGVKRSTNEGALIAMSGLWPLIGKKFYGEVGFDIFKPYVVQIDYERCLISLYDPARYQYHGTAPKLPARFYGAYDPQVEGELMAPGRPPIPVHFTLDTGAGGTIVASPIVTKNNLLEAVGRAIKAQDQGVGGAMPSEVTAQLAGFRIGPYTLKRPIVALSLDTEGSLSNEAISVNMGGNILRRFTVTIDYVHRWVALEPNRSFAKPFQSDASGLLLSAQGSDFRTFMVEGVIPNSPASEAGLQEGDQITAIGGKPAGAYALWRLQDELKTTGATVTLTAKRGDESLSKSLLLRSLI